MRIYFSGRPGYRTTTRCMMNPASWYPRVSCEPITSLQFAEGLTSSPAPCIVLFSKLRTVARFRDGYERVSLTSFSPLVPPRDLAFPFAPDPFSVSSHESRKHGEAERSGPANFCRCRVICQLRCLSVIVSRPFAFVARARARAR